MRSPRRPRPDGGDPVVVYDDADVRPLGDAGGGSLREVRELLGPVAPAALTDDDADGDVEGDERRGHPVALVVAGSPFGDARPQRRAACGRAPVFGSSHRRGAPPPDPTATGGGLDVADLVHERGVAGGPEGPRTVRLQPEGVPNAPDRGLRKAALAGHRAGRPMGGVGSGVRLMTYATRSSPTVHGRPDRPPRPTEQDQAGPGQGLPRARERTRRKVLVDPRRRGRDRRPRPCRPRPPGDPHRLRAQGGPNGAIQVGQHHARKRQGRDHRNLPEARPRRTPSRRLRNCRHQLQTMIPRFLHSAARTRLIPYHTLIAG